MIETNIIHIVPFDIGLAFAYYDYTNKTIRDDFIQSLSVFCYEENIEVIESNLTNCFFSMRINDDVSCYLLEYGIGVFVIKNINEIDTAPVEVTFDNNIACTLYYKKQKEQRLILDGTFIHSDIVNLIKQQIWHLTRNVERVFSARNDYKFNGFSYVLSIYHIIDSNTELINSESVDIDLLMNPYPINKICDEMQWDTIKHKINNYNLKGYSLKEYSATSDVISSWSAIIVIENGINLIIDRIIEYEIKLQASWFLFDCLIDNIKANHLSSLLLQKEKSLVTNVALDISIILSANIGLNEKEVFDSIYKTSGFDLLKEKLFLLLENQIAISDAKIKERQVRYGIFTEILLILFTLVSIYEPIKNIASGSIQKYDIAIGIALLVIFIISSYFIIRKEK